MANAKVAKNEVESNVETPVAEVAAPVAAEAPAAEATRHEPVSLVRLLNYFYETEKAEKGANGLPKTLTLRAGISAKTPKSIADELGMAEGSFRTRFSWFAKTVETLNYPRPKLADGRSGRKGQKRFTEDAMTRALKSLGATESTEAAK